MKLDRKSRIKLFNFSKTFHASYTIIEPFSTKNKEKFHILGLCIDPENKGRDYLVCKFEKESIICNPYQYNVPRRGMKLILVGDISYIEQDGKRVFGRRDKVDELDDIVENVRFMD